MPPRTNAAAVRKVYTDLDAAFDLEPFIEIANELVTEKCYTSGTDNDYSTTRLELIERWLAAHFAAVDQIKASGETAGPVGETKMYRLGLNLAVTMYGQQAMVLDTKGSLAQLSKQIEKGGRTRATIDWIGSTEEERRSWV